MRYAILSDIHGNLEALEATLQALDRLQIDRTVCLGDLVGYGANPNECIAGVQNVTDLVVVGNHDHAAVGMTDIDYFNPHARQAVLWTADQLTEANAAYLRGLPFVLDSEACGPALQDDVLFVHATADHPERWEYILTQGEAKRQLESLGHHLCFIGHSHQAIMLWENSDGALEATNTARALAPNGKAIINVGSVGQPRDGDPRAAFATWDTETGQIEIHRVPYEIKEAQRKIREAQLPEALARRLEYGE